MTRAGIAIIVPSRFGTYYAGGHVEEGGRQMYVSRGLGTSALPLRVRARPEIAVIELSCAAGASWSAERAPSRP